MDISKDTNQWSLLVVFNMSQLMPFGKALIRGG